MEAILLLGHGSRLTEANKTLKDMACMVKEMGDISLVEFAFLQFQKPNFFDGVCTCVSKGANKIIIHPYFLYKGRHFQEDMLEMIEEARKKYNDIEFVLTEPLGVHEGIAKVVLERAKKNIQPVKILKPYEIETRSFEIITAEMGEVNFSDEELSVVKRVIHATGDFDFAQNIRFHPEAIETGIEAIKNRMDILVDVRMVEAGINKKLLERFGGNVICSIQNTEHRTQSTEHRIQNTEHRTQSTEHRAQNTEHRTQTDMGIEMAIRKNNNIGIVAIGNAPTALYRTMKFIRDGVFQPKLVIGVPVGFVKAVESKEVLLYMKYPFITSLGRKGGSPVAVAIVNALLRIAEGSDNQTVGAGLVPALKKGNHKGCPYRSDNRDGKTGK